MGLRTTSKDPKFLHKPFRVKLLQKAVKPSFALFLSLGGAGAGNEYKVSSKVLEGHRGGLPAGVRYSLHAKLYTAYIYCMQGLYN